MKKTFLITYTMFFIDGTSTNGKIRVKNKPNEFVAKCSLEDYLKRKNPNFKSLIVHSCYDDFLSEFFNVFK